MDAPWFMRNKDIHRDLNLTTMDEEIRKIAQKHEKRLLIHPNPSVPQLLDADNFVRRLKRTKPLDLAQ